MEIAHPALQALKVIQAATATASATATTPVATATSGLPSSSDSGSSGGSSSLTALLVLVGVFFSLFMVIFWLSLIFWTWRDVRSRTQDVILQVVSTLLVAVFNVGGLFIYLIVRPRQTLAELYERQLEEESLLAEMTDRSTCPSCHYSVDKEFQICPNCGTKLRRPCPRCEHLLELNWNICPYCGYGGGAEGRAPARAGARER